MKKKHIITQFIISFSLLIICCSFMLLFSLRVHAAGGKYDYLTNNTYFKDLYTAAYSIAPDKTSLFSPDEIFSTVDDSSQYQYFFMYRYLRRQGWLILYVARADLSLDNGLNHFTINNYDYLNGNYDMCYISVNSNDNFDILSFDEAGVSNRSGAVYFEDFNSILESNNSNFVYLGFNSALPLYRDPELYISPTTFFGSDGGHSVGEPVAPDFDNFNDFGHDNSNLPDTLWYQKIFNRLGDIGNVLKNGFNNLYQNFKGFLQPALDNIKGAIDSVKDGVLAAFDSVKDIVTDFKDGVLSVLDQVNNTISVIGNVFNDFVDLGTDADGNFSIFTAVRRLIIPDDLDHLKTSFGSFVSSYIDNEKSSISVFVRFIAGLNNDYTNNVVPTFVIPGFILGGASIPDITISFEFLVPYMGVIRSMTSVFMWLSFIIYMIKDFPNFTRGVFHIAEEDLHPRPVYEVRD